MSCVMHLSIWTKMGNIEYAYYYSASKFNFLFNTFMTGSSKLQKPHKIYKFLAYFKFGMHPSTSVCSFIHLSVCATAQYFWQTFSRTQKRRCHLQICKTTWKWPKQAKGHAHNVYVKETVSTLLGKVLLKVIYCYRRVYSISLKTNGRQCWKWFRASDHFQLLTTIRTLREQRNVLFTRNMMILCKTANGQMLRNTWRKDWKHWRGA